MLPKDLELKGAFISSDSNEHEKRQRQSTKAVHIPSPCIKNIVTIPIPTRPQYSPRPLPQPRTTSHRKTTGDHTAKRANTHADSSVDRTTEVVSHRYLHSCHDQTPLCPGSRNPFTLPTPRTPTPEPKPVELPLTSFSYYRFVFGHKPFSTVEAPVSFYSERFGRYISLAGELPSPHHTPTETPLNEDFDGRLFFPLTHHKVYKALAEPRSLY